MKMPLDAIVWWELRRIPFNLLVGLAGVITIATILFVGGFFAPPGQDAIEPALMFLGIVSYALAANALYTVGWVSEILWTGGETARTAALRARIFRLGLAFSVGLTLLPAVFVLMLAAVLGLR